MPTIGVSGWLLHHMIQAVGCSPLRGVCRAFIVRGALVLAGVLPASNGQAGHAFAGHLVRQACLAAGAGG